MAPQIPAVHWTTDSVTSTALMFDWDTRETLPSNKIFPPEGTGHSHVSLRFEVTMDKADQIILIECSRETALELQDKLEAIPEAQVKIAGQKNLEGDAAIWIVVATIVAKTLPVIIDVLSSRSKYTDTSIEIDGIKITPKNRKDYERLMNLAMARLEQRGDE